MYYCVSLTELVTDIYSEIIKSVLLYEESSFLVWSATLTYTQHKLYAIELLNYCDLDKDGLFCPDSGVEPRR